MSDYQFEYEGLSFGAGTEFPVNRVAGIFRRSLNIFNPDLPRNHGGLVGSSYENPRRIEMEIEVHGSQDDGAFLARRDALMAAFQPKVDTEPPLTFQLPGGAARRINCRPTMVDSPVDIPSEFGLAVFFADFNATDPAIYSDSESSVLLTPFVSAAGLSYPVTYPKAYGSGGSGGGATINNDGEWMTWPTIVIDGPSSGTLTDPIIEHLTSGLKLALNANGGVAMTPGQQLVIDSHPARRSIRFDTGASRYGKLSTDSDWFSLSPGSNELRFRASGSTSGATATVSARSAWI